MATRAVVERGATIGGVRTRVLERAGDGPTILLLHGFADSADTWRPLLAAMGADDHRLVAVDLPLFGRAQRPQARPMLDLLDRFTEAVIESHAHDGEVLVVGNSLGGLLSMRAAARGQQPISGIVPIGPAGLGLQPWVGVVERAGTVLTAAARTPIPTVVIQRAAGEIFKVLASSGGIDRRAVRDFSSHIGRGDPARLMALAQELVSELGRPSVVDPERIDCPVVLVWGGRDRLCPPSGAQRFLESAPNARLEMLWSRGHCVQLEDPHRVREIVLDAVSDR